jgi:hypothetical protein
MLGELHGYGFVGLTLPPNAADADWGRTLSIGEHDVTVTLGNSAARLAPARMSLADVGRLVRGRDLRR